jgi:hypothetical protein
MMNELSFYEGYLEGKRRQDEIAKLAHRVFYDDIDEGRQLLGKGRYINRKSLPDKYRCSHEWDIPSQYIKKTKKKGLGKHKPVVYPSRIDM